MPDSNEPNPPEDLPVGNTPLFAANEKIEKINVADEIKNSFLDYSMSVIISRALPDVRDGDRAVSGDGTGSRRHHGASHRVTVSPGRAAQANRDGYLRESLKFELRLPTSNLRLRTSDFTLQTSHFRLHTSYFFFAGAAAAALGASNELVACVLTVPFAWLN